ncbi:MAG TPA: dihydrodipicolinate synthase family protein [Stellaceae bacterium]|nr:dihydrodipicolinate synthase family protein [Stellaceae bacterium]
MPLIDESARGFYVISATPFAEDGAMDWASTDRLMDFYLDCGVDGVTILGIMGEAQKLSQEESAAFVTRVMRRIGARMPVVVGVTSAGTKLAGDLARHSMDLGAAGVMVAGNGPLRTDDQIYAYFEGVIAELGTEIPMVLQDYPQTTNVHFSPSLLNRIFSDFSTVKMLKHEEAPGLRKISRLRAAEASGARKRRISILSGNGALHLMQELARGVDGAMTGFAYPEALVEVLRRWFAGDREAAEDLYDAYLPAIRHENQLGLGLALRKETLRRRGVIASARTRSPGPVLDADDQADLTHLLRRLERAKAKLGIALPPLQLAGQ